MSDKTETRTVYCARCAGTGEYPPTGGVQCSTCGGSGDYVDIPLAAEAHRDRLWKVYEEARADEREAFVNWRNACYAVETVRAQHTDAEGRSIECLDEDIADRATLK